MAVVLRCDCGKVFAVPESVAARKGKCPGCGLVLAIPHFLDEPEVRLHLRGHRLPVTGVALSPDSTLVATLGSAETTDKAHPAELKLWSAITGTSQVVAGAHKDAIEAAVFSPDGETLITASRDQTLGVWDVASGIKTQVLRGHTAPVETAIFSHDGSTLVSAAADGLFFWEVETWRKESARPCDRAGRCSLAFSPDGRTLAVGYSSRGPVVLLDARDRTQLGTLQLPREEDTGTLAVAFGRASDALAVLSQGSIHVWDLTTQQVLVTIDAPYAQSIAFSKNGRTLAAGGWDVVTHTDVWLYDALTGHVRSRLKSHNLPVTAIALSGDGTRLVSASRDLTASVWWLADDSPPEA